MADRPVELEHDTSSERLGILAPVTILLMLLTLVIGGAVVLTDDEEPDPLELLSAAPAAVRDAGAARVEMTAKVSGAGMSMDMSGEGFQDFETGAFTFTMSFFGLSMEMRAIDETMYMKMPEIARPPGVDASWLAVPLVGDGMPSPTGTPGAASMIESLRGMGNEVVELGESEINGEDATGYRVVIDLARAIDELPEADRAQVEEPLAQMDAMGMSEWPMEVWVGDDGLPLRMVMDVEDVGVDGVSMHMQMDFLDYGMDVDIEAPPAEDTLLLENQAELNELFDAPFLEDEAA